MATGFHGAHVIIGSIMLAVSLYRLVNYHFTKFHLVGLETAILYWREECRSTAQVVVYYSTLCWKLLKPVDLKGKTIG